MLQKKVATLAKRDGVREHAAYLGKLRAGSGDERMVDTKCRFAHDGHVVFQQKVVVIGDCPVQAVFNRQHGSIYPLLHKLFKDLGRECARHQCLHTEQSIDGKMAVGARLPLDCDTHAKALPLLFETQVRKRLEHSKRHNFARAVATTEVYPATMFMWLQGPNQRPRPQRQGIWRTTMLWTITVILIVLWALGLVGGYTLGGWIHILIVLAIISLIFNLLAGRRAL